MQLRSLVLASVAALVVTSFDAPAARAASSSAPASEKQANTQQLAADQTEVGARKRYRARTVNGSAGVAMMGAMIGTIGAVVAAQRAQEAYQDSYYAPYGDGYHTYQDPSALPAGPLNGGYGGHYGNGYARPRIGWER